MMLERLKKWKKWRTPLAIALVLGSWGTFGLVHFTKVDVTVDVGESNSTWEMDAMLSARLAQEAMRHPNAGTFRLYGVVRHDGRGSLPYQLHYSRPNATISLEMGSQVIFSNVSESAIQRVGGRGEYLFSLQSYGATREWRPALRHKIDAALQTLWR